MSMRRLGLFIATCSYVGYVPVAPGTFGSAAGLAVFYAVRASGSSAIEAATIVVIFLVTCWASIPGPLSSMKSLGCS
jgi:phosphatidylglycerophosphatase A